jgi:hypothetical protein
MQPISPFMFRLLVVLSAVLPLSSGLLNNLFLPSLPIGHSALVFEDTRIIFLILGFLNLFLGIATTIGLCLFRRWSRSVSLFSIALGVINYSMCSYFVDSGIKVAVDSLSTLLGGGVITMAYFSPIANRFGPNNSFKPNPLRGSA